MPAAWSSAAGAASHAVAASIGREAYAVAAADGAARDGEAAEVGRTATDADARLERGLRGTADDKA